MEPSRTQRSSEPQCTAKIAPSSRHHARRITRLYSLSFVPVLQDIVSAAVAITSTIPIRNYDPLHRSRTKLPIPRRPQVFDGFFNKQATQMMERIARQRNLHSPIVSKSLNFHYGISDVETTRPRRISSPKRWTFVKRLRIPLLLYSR